MTHAEKWERERQARKLVMLQLRTGPSTLDEARKPLKPLGNFGTRAGCKWLLDNLVAQGVVLFGRCRQRPTGPLVEAYRLPLWVCRVCGCDQGNACIDSFGEPCYWAEPDLCNACKKGAPGADKEGG